MCIDIMGIWFVIVNGQISSIFENYLSVKGPYFHFQIITLLNSNGFTPDLVCALIL